MVSLLLLTTIGTSLGLSISRGYWCNPVRLLHFAKNEINAFRISSSFDVEPHHFVTSAGFFMVPFFFINRNSYKGFNRFMVTLFHHDSFLVLDMRFLCTLGSEVMQQVNNQVKQLPIPVSSNNMQQG
ncbi:uncharacterized protein LOC110881811 [Helianthus annuus]|uniref:uncharacterized protein LOC110881811 n=1 Tax=Helianthus annuus TaxID=4232 RepID=UPI000B905725|nr:uncharacterized protein LOC110881811 [Helianthus annuus]